MPIARVTTAKAEPASEPAQASIATGAFNAATGNLIVVFIRLGGEGAFSSISDTAGNTYVEAISDITQDPRLYCYYAKNITGNANNVVTVNFSPSGMYSWAYAVQYSGADTISPLNVIEAKTGIGVTDIVADAITTTVDGEVVVAATSQNNFTTYTAGADFTLLDGNIGDSSGNNFGGVQEYIPAGTLSNYVTHITSGVINPYTILVVSFKPAAAGGQPSIKRLTTVPHLAGSLRQRIF